MYCLYHNMSANPVLPPVLFNRLSPDSSKLMPTFVNQAVLMFLSAGCWKFGCSET